MIRVAFESSTSCQLTAASGQTETVLLPAPDWEAAKERLTVLNRLLLSNGERLSAQQTIEGFEPWWFGQDYLLRSLLLPLQQYKLIIDRLVKTSGPVIIIDAPREFLLHMAPLLKRLGVQLRFEHPSNQTSSLREALGFAMKLSVTLISLVVNRLRKPRLLLYVLKPVDSKLGCDRRLKDLYAELKHRKISFTELVFSGRSMDAWQEITARRSLSIYYFKILELIKPFLRTPMRPVLSTEPQEPIERALLETYWEYTAWQRLRVRVFQLLFNYLKPPLLLILDDQREMFSIVAAAKLLHIPTVSYQHGLFTLFHAGLFDYGWNNPGRRHAPDAYIVWNALARERLLSEGSLFLPEEILVGGHIRHLFHAKSIPDRRPNGKVRILWAGEPLSQISQVMPYIESIAHANELDIRYRPRPDGMTRRHEDRVQEWKMPISLSPYASLDEDLKQADVVIGTYSSLLYESYLYLVPSVLMQVPEGLAMDRLAENSTLIAERPEDLKSRILEAANLSLAERLDRQARLWGKAGQFGFQIVADLCELLLDKNLKLSVRQAIDRLKPENHQPVERTLAL